MRAIFLSAALLSCGLFADIIKSSDTVEVKPFRYFYEVTQHSFNVETTSDSASGEISSPIIVPILEDSETIEEIAFDLAAFKDSSNIPAPSKTTQTTREFKDKTVIEKTLFSDRLRGRVEGALFDAGVTTSTDANLELQGIINSSKVYSPKAVADGTNRRSSIKATTSVSIKIISKNLGDTLFAKTFDSNALIIYQSNEKPPYDEVLYLSLQNLSRDITNALLGVPTSEDSYYQDSPGKKLID